MTDTVIDLVLNELYRVVTEEVDLLRVVKEEIEKLKKELNFMKAFLRCTDFQKEKDPMLESWVEEVRDVAFEIEDVVDQYLLRVAYGHGADAGDARSICFGRICSPFRKLKAKHQIGSELQSVKEKVREIAERPKRYGYDLSHVNLYGKGSSTSSGKGNLEIEEFRRSSAALVDESQLVGIDKTKEVLMNLLNNGDIDLNVLAIFGMGGLGKTALVRQICREMSHFQRRAFVTVSQTLNEQDLVKDMVHQLFPLEMLEMQNLSIDQLKEGIREKLKDESYLIVVDDVWKIKHWDQIKVLFPRNKHGSRVVVTTRMSRVATHSCSEHKGIVYPLQPLSQSASWELFYKRTFPTTQTCPSNLEPMCKDIVFNKCMGVPIAILAISGLLRNKDEGDIDAWIQKIQHSLEIELEDNEELEMTKKILSLSFDDLPYHVKPCYMYLSIFPEDYNIQWKKVIRLWISEGFVAKRDGRTVEEDADRYLWELVDRSLIQIRGMKGDGSRRPKVLRIHDFLREIVLSKCKQERFFEVMSKGKVVDIRARRLCFHDHHDALKRLPELLPIRSLLMFFATKLGNDDFKFRLLCVLDLEGVSLDSFPEEICTLLLLRYLSLKKTKISNIPNSIGNLARLETLNLKYTFISELPDQISMLQKLRHLLIYSFLDEKDAEHFDHEKIFCVSHDESYGVKVRTNIGGLIWLQELCFVQVPENNEWIKALGSLSELRKLGLVNLKAQHWIEVCSCISKLKKLRCLMLQTNEWFELEHLKSPPPALEQLHLVGYMFELPSWMSPSSLRNLKVLKLYNTRLSKDPGATLGTLPKLVGLYLSQAFSCRMRVVLPGFFPSLRVLTRFGYRNSIINESQPWIDESQWKNIALSHVFGADEIGLDILIPTS